jgi:hypothetical protein
MPQDLEEVRKRAQKIIAGSVGANLLCAVMIASRRLYDVASDALEVALINEDDCKELIDYMTGAARQEAAREFTLEELFNSVTAGVLPFLLQETVQAAVNQCKFHESNGG